MSKKNTVLTFKPAQLSTGKEWFVYYYVLNPSTEKLDRKKIKLNRISSKKERRQYALRLIDDLNKKLYNGWNPYIEQSAPKGFTQLIEIIDIFYSNKERELRKDSLRSYRSFCDTLKLWLQKNELSEIYAINFNRVHAFDYLDWLVAYKNVSNNTWNNYITFMRSFFNWMIERQYCSKNPFNNIRKKSKQQKERVIIPIEERSKILDHLEQEDYNFLIVCLLVFHSLIRPKEITFLKPSSFLLANQTIIIPGTVSKNKKSRVATIPNVLVPYLSKWNYNNAKADEYIFGKDLLPGKEPVDARRFTKKWDKIRKVLNLPDEMKLYSLRDSGIVQMLNDGISPEQVMMQADHSSLEITTVYAKFNNPKGSEQIKTRGSGFSSDHKKYD